MRRPISSGFSDLSVARLLQLLHDAKPPCLIGYSHGTPRVGFPTLRLSLSGSCRRQDKLAMIWLFTRVPHKRHWKALAELA
jgi:hypothetical protein